MANIFPGWTHLVQTKPVRAGPTSRKSRERKSATLAKKHILHSKNGYLLNRVVVFLEFLNLYVKIHGELTQNLQKTII